MKSVIDLANQVKDYAAAGKTIASVENGTTAVGSYAVGKQFIREGVLYKAKTSITAGDTLTLNTNYELADDLDTQIGNVKQALSNEVAYAGLKNKIGEIDRTNLTNICTLNADKSITINGTMPSGNSWITIIPILSVKSGNYTLSGCPAGGSTSTYYMYVKDDTSNTQVLQDTGSGATAYLDGSHALKVVIFAQAGQSINKTFYPMLRLASESDATYEPYAYPNSQLLSYKDNGVLGAKNVLPCTLAYMKELNRSGTWSGNVYTKNGLDFTVNTDSDGNVLNINANGTASENTTIWLAQPKKGYGTILFSAGFASTGSDSSFIAAICVANGGTAFTGRLISLYDNGSYPYDLDSYNGDTYYVFGIGSGYTANNVKIYPMLRLASDTDPTYQPYAMTNKELTDVAVQEKGNYMLVGMKTLSVTGDGIKTAKELLNEMALSYLSILSAMPSNKGASITAINSYVPHYSGTGAVPSIVIGARGIQKNTTSDVNIVFQGTFLAFGSPQKVGLIRIMLNSTLSSCKLEGYDVLTSSSFDDLETAIPSAQKMYLYYNEYQLVN